MITLTTNRRKIATVFAAYSFSFFLILCGSSNDVDAQNFDPSMTETPLTIDEPQVSVLKEVNNLHATGGTVQAFHQEAEKPAAPESLDAIQPENVDILTRGPLHEAFATVHQANPGPSPLITKKPPAAIEEVPPEYKPDGKNVQWIPGYWSWDDSQSDFIWISGVWRDIPPGRRWVPGYWDEAEDGYRWVSGFWADEETQELGYLPEPPTSIDQGPSIQSPGDDYFYVPGNWDYYNGRYRWLTGHWQPVVKHWIWIPARYVWTPLGCIYQSGYWDYEIEYRGTCFAPVYFHRPIYTAVHYRYTPTCVVNLNINFLTHLFVRPNCGHYFYGNWYGTNFVNYGYKPWVHYHSHHRHYDPLLAYYRCQPSSYDRRYNVVQYLAQQHNFYAQHDDYRPRPTFYAQFNFANNSKHLRYHDYVRRSSYVQPYADVVHHSENAAKHRHKELQHDKRQLANETSKRQAKFKRIQQQERLQEKKNIDSLNKFQKQRRQTELKRTAGHVNRVADSREHRPVTSFKIPQLEKSGKKIRRDSGSELVSGNKNARVSNGTTKALNRAIESARQEAARKEAARKSSNQLKTQKQNLDRIHAERVRRQRADQIQSRQRTANKRDEPSRPGSSTRGQNSSQQQQKKITQNKQKQRQSNAARDKARQEALKRQQEKLKQDRPQRQRQPSNREPQQRNQQNRAEEQRRVEKQKQDQARAKQDQLKRAQENARDAQRKQDQLRRSQQAAKRAQERQKQDRARRAQNQSRRDAAQKAARDRQRQQQANRQKQQQQKNKPAKKR